MKSKYYKPHFYSICQKSFVFPFSSPALCYDKEKLISGGIFHAAGARPGCVPDFHCGGRPHHRGIGGGAGAPVGDGRPLREGFPQRDGGVRRLQPAPCRARHFAAVLQRLPLVHGDPPRLPRADPLPLLRVGQHEHRDGHEHTQRSTVSPSRSTGTCSWPNCRRCCAGPTTSARPCRCWSTAARSSTRRTTPSPATAAGWSFPRTNTASCWPSWRPKARW